MKQPGLISLILILASTAKGENWAVIIPNRNITATSGQDVVIQCNFTYPSDYHSTDVKLYWKKGDLRSSFDTKDQDQKAFIFHPNNTFVLEKYRNRTKLIGNKDKGNCSLEIKNVTENEPNIYVRLIGKGEQYSFIKDQVSISLPGVEQPIPDLLPTTESNTMNMTEENSTTNYMAIFVPVAALLIIIVVVGIAFCIKHKRSKSLTRQDSGYYANFRRSSSHQANREANCKKEDKKLPEPKAIDEPVYLKAIDEPVYINMEAPSDQMDQSMDHSESVYANVDYLK